MRASEEPPALIFLTLVVLSAVIPIVYVFSLPYLAKKHFAEPLCTDDDKKAKVQKGHCSTTGASVSGYISNAHATGGMAAAFFPAQMLMWVNALFKQYSFESMLSLATFQVCFSGFLMCNVTWKREMHYVIVFLFCIAGAIHLSTLLPSKASKDFVYTRWPLILLLGVGISALTGVLTLCVFSFVQPNSLDEWPMLFWKTECIGLSAFVLYVPLLLLLRQRNDIDSVFGLLQSGLQSARDKIASGSARARTSMQAMKTRKQK